MTRKNINQLCKKMVTKDSGNFIRKVKYSYSFKKLEKITQVFGSCCNLFPITNRASHSILVAEIGKKIGIEINKRIKIKLIDVDFIILLSLLHDLGQLPFGHAGERALNNCLLENNCFFEHNYQLLMVVKYLESFNFPEIVFNSLCVNAKKGFIKRVKNFQLHFSEFDMNSYNENYKILEYSICKIADTIAYLFYDILDCINLKILDQNEVKNMPIINKYYNNNYNYDLIEIIISNLINNIANYVANYISDNKINFDINYYYESNLDIISYTPDILSEINYLKEEMNKKIYRGEPTEKYDLFGEKIIKTVFKIINNNDIFDKIINKIKTYINIPTQFSREEKIITFFWSQTDESIINLALQLNSELLQEYQNLTNNFEIK